MDLAAAVEFVRPRRNGVLTTLKRDGRPQLSNIAFLADDGGVRISVTDSRAKTRNVRRDPRVSLYVPGDDFWHWVVIEGTATAGPPAAAPDDPVVEDLIALYRDLAGEHPDWDDYRRAMVDDGRLVLHIAPERAYGMA
jgi:PPOX class probable F420-dependent enzyme